LTVAGGQAAETVRHIDEVSSVQQEPGKPMLSLDVHPKHSIAQVRKDARHYFGEVLGLEEGDTAEQRRMLFTGAGGYVSLEFSSNGAASEPSVLMHTREYEGQVHEFARIIG